MARPIARGVLSFGLVAIPVEIHSATTNQTIRFHILHAKCGSRVRNQTVCPACNTAIERSDLVAVINLKRASMFILLKKSLNP
jgi:DNA end-binding protein Ku